MATTTTETTKPTKHETSVSPTEEVKQYAQLGNVLNALSVAMTSIFFVSVMLYADDPNQFIFAKEWAKVGYCVSNPDVPYWTSHDLSLYADIVYTMIFFVLIYNWKDEPYMQGIHSKRGMDLAMSILLHGIGHGFVGYFARQVGGGDDTDGITEVGQGTLVMTITAFTLFWLPTMIAALDGRPMWIVAIVAALASLGQEVVHFRFNFVYIQVVLSLVAGVHQLLLPKEKKGREYAMFGAIVTVPVALAAWVECITCGDFYKSLGGHVLYDSTIAICLLTFYTYAYLHGRASKLTKKKLE